jgi:hypothetical protein
MQPHRSTTSHHRAMTKRDVGRGSPIDRADGSPDSAKIFPRSKRSMQYPASAVARDSTANVFIIAELVPALLVAAPRAAEEPQPLTFAAGKLMRGEEEIAEVELAKNGAMQLEKLMNMLELTAQALEGADTAQLQTAAARLKRLTDTAAVSKRLLGRSDEYAGLGVLVAALAKQLPGTFVRQVPQAPIKELPSGKGLEMLELFEKADPKVVRSAPFAATYNTLVHARVKIAMSRWINARVRVTDVVQALVAANPRLADTI